MLLCTRKGIIQWILLCVIHNFTFLNRQIWAQSCMKRRYPVICLFGAIKCDLCRATAMTPAKNYNSWHKCHNCFDCDCWCLTSPSVLCTMCLQWPAAEASNQLQWEALIERVFSVDGYHVFCFFSNQPLSANAILTFYRFLYRFPTTYTHTVGDNAQVNIIFLWLYTRYGSVVMWGTAEFRPLLCGMHNHNKQCPEGNYVFSPIFFSSPSYCFFIYHFRYFFSLFTFVNWFLFNYR